MNLEITVIIIVLSVLILLIAVFAGLTMGKKQKKIVGEGHVVKRQYGNPEVGEEFTSRIGSFMNLKERLQRMSLQCAMEGTVKKLVFRGATYSARLYCCAYDNTTGVAIYRFEFTSFKVYRNMYQENDSMNILMAAVQSVFFGLDPNTSVKTYKLNLKTKRSIL